MKECNVVVLSPIFSLLNLTTVLLPLISCCSAQVLWIFGRRVILHWGILIALIMWEHEFLSSHWINWINKNSCYTTHSQLEDCKYQRQVFLQYFSVLCLRNICVSWKDKQNILSLKVKIIHEILLNIRYEKTVGFTPDKLLIIFPRRKKPRLLSNGQIFDLSP